MAPILSLTKDSLDCIRESVSLTVVSIWQVDDSSNSKKSFRSGFVLDCFNDRCIVVTLAKDLDYKKGGTFVVQFENGQRFESLTTFGNKRSDLVAILVTGLNFEPKVVNLSENNARQCEEVVHMGNFDKKNPNLNFSTGSVGLAGHKPPKQKEGFTAFMHCCSQRLHLIGGPVFNLRSEIIGLNYSQKKNKNLFFSLDLEQLKRELKWLFGENMEQMTKFMSEAETTHSAKRTTHSPKRRKT